MTLRKAASELNKNISDLTVMILDRDRHESIIKTLRKVGVRIKFLSDLDNEFCRKVTETSYSDAPNRSVYYLGNERGFISIDSEWLVFDYNEKGVVTNVQIST